MHQRLRSASCGAFLFLCSSVCLAAQSNDWEIVGQAGISAGQAVCTQITFDPQGRPCVAYQDQTVYGGHAIVLRFDGANWASVGTPGQASIADAWYDMPRFDAAGDLFLASRDYGAGGSLSVRRFAAGGSSWTSVGPNAVTDHQAHYTALAIRSDGIPYATFADRGTTPRDRASVVRYDAAAGVWDFVGPRGITAEPSSYNTLAFDSHGVLYTAFADRAFLDPMFGAKATVMRWDEASASWSPVGLPGFSPQGVANLVLAIDHQDRLHVAYYRFHDKLVVLRFDGTNWVQLGGSASGVDRPAVESEGWRQWLSLCFDSQDQPYIAYELFDAGFRAAVRRFDGAAWQLVGRRGFTPDVADYLSLAIDRSDVPHVVFVDGSQNRKVSVMRYAPSPWVYGSPSANALGCPVDLDTAGTPSLSSVFPFQVEATGVPSHHSGMLIWSDAPAEIPFAGGTLYLQPPVHRTALQDSGGATGAQDCSGHFAFDFNPLLASGGSGLSVGRYAFAQYWYRDSAGPGASSLSAGLRFRIEP